MKVVFLNSFKKDVQKIMSLTLKEQTRKTIIAIETAENIYQLKNLKKMKGHPSAYRIRLGNYRLGFYADRDVVVLVRLVKRNDIYKVFPQ